MPSATLVLRDAGSPQGEDPETEELGVYEFIRLPVGGELLTCEVDDAVASFKVVEVRHYPQSVGDEIPSADVLVEYMID